jgi:uncharacterized protein YjbI with pentapeptide repeats
MEDTKNSKTLLEMSTSSTDPLIVDSLSQEIKSHKKQHAEEVASKSKIVYKTTTCEKCKKDFQTQKGYRKTNFCDNCDPSDDTRHYKFRPIEGWSFDSYKAKCLLCKTVIFSDNSSKKLGCPTCDPSNTHDKFKYSKEHKCYELEYAKSYNYRTHEHEKQGSYSNSFLDHYSCNKCLFETRFRMEEREYLAVKDSYPSTSPPKGRIRFSPNVLFDPAKHIERLVGDLSVAILVLDYTDRDFSGSNLTKLNLRGALFSGFNFSDSKFAGADLTGADFRGANLVDSDFTCARLNNAKFQEADLSRCIMMGANCTEANFHKSFLVETNFCHTILDKAFLTEVDLSLRNNLLKTSCRFTDFSESSLKSVDLSTCFFEGTTFIKTYLKYSILKFLDLSCCCFIEAELENADLRGTNLDEADFTDADLKFALLFPKSSKGTIFTNADTFRAKLGVYETYLDLGGTPPEDYVECKELEQVVLEEKAKEKEFLAKEKERLAQEERDAYEKSRFLKGVENFEEIKIPEEEVTLEKLKYLASQKGLLLSEETEEVALRGTEEEEVIIIEMEEGSTYSDIVHLFTYLEEKDIKGILMDQEKEETGKKVERPSSPVLEEVEELLPIHVNQSLKENYPPSDNEAD